MEGVFNWQDCWYPVILVADLPTDKPYGFSLYGEPLVLFRDNQGQLACLPNRCPHRASRLSDGQLSNGNLECLYHGWQFNALGECIKIPQLPADKHIPKPACLTPYQIAEVQGLVWLWPGAAEFADVASIPTIPALAQADMVSMDYVIDLPYDQTYLIENVIDVAHIHIAHHGIRGGGNRQYALPLEFAVIENSMRGIKSRFRSIGLSSERKLNNINSAEVEFVAPNLIHYVSNYQDSALVSGLALYSIPLASGRCRLLYRKYSNFYAWRELMKPRWLDHWTLNTILKQDMAIIIGQYSAIERSGKNLKDMWLTLKTSDTLVIQYRKWLDKYAVDTPFYRGYASHKLAEDNNVAFATDVYTMHTHQCSACLTAYQITKNIQTGLLVFLPLLLPLLIQFHGSHLFVWVEVAYGFGVLFLGLLEKIKRQFE